MIETLCQGVKSAHDWTPEQKNSMRRLFEYALRTWPNLVVCVRETQGTLVFRAQEKGNYDWRSLADFDLELIRLADSGEQEAALNRIAEKLRDAVREFWPDCPLASYSLFLKQRLERLTESSTSAERPATAR